jgi:hypothetical protein
VVNRATSRAPLFLETLRFGLVALDPPVVDEVNGSDDHAEDDCESENLFHVVLLVNKLLRSG